MNTSHAPGSFRVIATEANISVVSQDGIHVSDIEGYGATHETNKANAVLLASAPDLLAALKAMLRASIDPMGLNAANAAALARQAIAKAKGEA
jgi:hypothetical protein